MMPSPIRLKWHPKVQEFLVATHEDGRCTSSTHVLDMSATETQKYNIAS